MPEKRAAFDQSSSRASDHEPHSRNSWPMKIMGIPGAASTDVPGDPLVVLHVLGDRDLPGLTSTDLGVDPSHHSPAIGDVRARVIVGSPDVADPASGVPSQPVAIALLQPTKRVVAEVLPHLAAAVIGPGVAPGSLLAPVVIEINSSLIVAARRTPAVELP